MMNLTDPEHADGIIEVDSVRFGRPAISTLADVIGLKSDHSSPLLRSPTPTSVAAFETGITLKPSKKVL